MMLSLHNIYFRHENALDFLFEDINASFPQGWTGIVGANGTGKTTFLRIVCGELQPEKGRVHRPGSVLYCQQRTDFPPEMLGDLLQSTDGEACLLRGKLRLGADWLDRWDTLSHGERKRAQIAVALWRQPDVLAVDEPTNHIDADARRLLADALGTFKGIGLLVSHDRELLDSLCAQCLFIDPPSAVMRPGGYSRAVEQARLEDEHVRAEYEAVKRSAKQIAREAARRRAEASRADKLRSKRKIPRGDKDAKGRIDLAIFTGADGKAGRLASQLDGRVQQAMARYGKVDIKRKYELNFWLPGSRSGRRTLFDIPAGSIKLGGGRELSFPELSMSPDDRVAVTGPNGGGKSTLIRHIYASLTLPEDKVIYIPQEIDEETSHNIMLEVNSLPNDQLGTVMTVVSCLGSRPERLVRNMDVSPGEIRKVLLALGVSRAPHLIIMDEPTNHLDLPAIECLEQALEGCPCGLLLVSHDYRFLSKLAKWRWDIGVDVKGRGSGSMRLKIVAMEERD